MIKLKLFIVGLIYSTAKHRCTKLLKLETAQYRPTLV